MKEERLPNERELPKKFKVVGPKKNGLTMDWETRDLMSLAYELNRHMTLSHVQRLQLRQTLRAIVKDGHGELILGKFTVIYPAPEQ